MEVPLEKKLDDLYKLIDGIDTAMITTRRADGHLISRPMQTQRRTTGTDLWFMTNVESEKYEELSHDDHINVAYYNPRTREWVSVSGRAILSRDRDLIDSLYHPSWRAWLGDLGDGRRDGGPHDPRIALILVEAESVVYSKNDRPIPLAIYQAVKSMITHQPAPADVRRLNHEELETPRDRPDLQ